MAAFRAQGATNLAAAVALTRQQSALNASLALRKAQEDVAAVSKTSIGLGNVDNTSDAGKPVSTAQQTALNAKLGTWVSVPASASATGSAGQIARDSSFIYVCVATNTWCRAAIATW